MVFVPILAPSWGLLGPFWGHIGASWCLLGPSWGHLGSIFEHLRASWGPWGHLGAILGPSCGLLGPSWGHILPSWCLLGPSLAILGPLGSVLEPFGAILGPSLAILGHLGPTLGQSSQTNSKLCPPLTPPHWAGTDQPLPALTSPYQQKPPLTSQNRIAYTPFPPGSSSKLVFQRRQRTNHAKTSPYQPKPDSIHSLPPRQLFEARFSATSTHEPHFQTLPKLSTTNLDPQEGQRCLRQPNLGVPSLPASSSKPSSIPSFQPTAGPEVYKLREQALPPVYDAPPTGKLGTG